MRYAGIKNDFVMLRPEILKPFEFRKRDKSKELHESHFQMFNPANASFEQLQESAKVVTLKDLKKTG